MTTNETRAAKLTAARRLDSQEKRQRVQEAVNALERAGVAVTFAGVAKTARVSTWLVYADGVRQHVDAGRQRQARYGIADKPEPLPAPMQATPAGIRTDLAIAHQEIKSLREERDRLRSRLRLELGAELDASSRAELVGRANSIQEIASCYSPATPQRRTTGNSAARTANSRTTSRPPEKAFDE
jgi:hypothetical protein